MYCIAENIGYLDLLEEKDLANGLIMASGY